VPDWDRVPGEIRKACIYYTDNKPPESILRPVQRQLLKAGLPIVAVSLQPIGFGQNVVLGLQRGVLSMFKQILAGLEATEAEVVFFTEHDVLYHPSHFAFVPPKPDRVYYNTNVWKVDYATGHAVRYDNCRQTSGLCAYRDILLDHYRKRVAMVEAGGFSRKMGFEPGTHGRPERVDDLTSEVWESPAPNIDIRHSTNLTPSRWSPAEFRDKRFCQGWTEADAVPGWGATKGRFDLFLKEHTED
jgi:hypothetical protein